MLAPDPKRYTIGSLILADDDEDDHELFRDALNKISPSTSLSVVKDGEELIGLLQHYLPDMIFLDLDMPCKNGLQCIQEIRSNPQTSNIPLVIFSSTTKPSNIVTAYEIGADLYFVKPASFGVLIASIQRILEMDWSQPDSVKERYYVGGKYMAFTGLEEEA